MNRMVPCSVKSAEGGFRAEVAWQYIDAGERRSQKMTTLELAQPLRAEWNAKSAPEPLADREISRHTNAFVNEANQCKSSEVPFNAQHV